MKKRTILLAGLILLFSIWSWSAPGWSKLNIVVRDSLNPCKPYSSSAHSFIVAIFNCDKSLFTVEPLTRIGPGGGRIYGEIKVPSGTYILVGVSHCKNVWTNWTMVVAGCEQDVCVNLLPRRFEQCASEMRWATTAALIASRYSLRSPPQEIEKDMRKALEKVKDALANLSRYLPKYELPVSLEDLREAKAPKELLELWQSLIEKK